MYLQPNSNWQWKFDEERQMMTLLIDPDMLFVSGLEARKMSPIGFEASSFSCQHTQAYYHYLESLEPFAWPDPIKVQLALNALAACEFHKPLMPQSWFFAHQGEMQECHKGEILMLETERGDAYFMVVEVETTSALCMAIETNTYLTSTKYLPQFGIVKVMRDRLKPLPVAQTFAQTA
jgi:cell division protein ZapC